MEVFIENFDKIVNRLQIWQIIIIDIDTNAEIKSSISSVNNFKISELDIQKNKNTVNELMKSLNGILQQNLYA